MRRSASRGLDRLLFREFAFTLAGAVIISGIVAVTLSPMMSSKLLKPHGAQGRFAAFVDRTFTRLENWYEGALGFAGLPRRDARHRRRSPWHHGVHVHQDASELAPEEDQGAYLGLVNTPKYATADYTQLFSKQFTPGEKIPRSTTAS